MFRFALISCDFPVVESLNIGIKSMTMLLNIDLTVATKNINGRQRVKWHAIKHATRRVRPLHLPEIKVLVAGHRKTLRAGAGTPFWHIR